MTIIPLIPRMKCATPITIATGFADLVGELEVPPDAQGVVVFVHGSGSNRHSPRNQFVARAMREAGLGTLLINLLTCKEQQEDASTHGLRQDAALLAKRLVGVTHWLGRQPETRDLKVGYFGASSGSAAALMAAAELGDKVAAVVSRGGRPDLAGNVLHQICSPTLLIVGGYDEQVICLNDEAYQKLCCTKDFRIVPGASHLFEEPGKLEQVARFSAQWFNRHMGYMHEHVEADA